jgi:hypothetical protein
MKERLAAQWQASRRKEIFLRIQLIYVCECSTLQYRVRRTAERPLHRKRGHGTRNKDLLLPVVEEDLEGAILPNGLAAFMGIEHVAHDLARLVIVRGFGEGCGLRTLLVGEGDQQRAARKGVQVWSLQLVARNEQQKPKECLQCPVMCASSREHASSSGS